jgi:hypothetical protein
MRKTYTLCDHEGCPLKRSCARYLEDLDRTMVYHFATMPYDVRRGKCGFYENDNDLLNELNIVSGGKEG